MGGFGIHLLRGRGDCDWVIFVVYECIWNAFVVLLGLSTFVYGLPGLSSALGFMLIPGTCFLIGNGEGELKHTTFSSLLHFSVFCLYFSPASPSYIVP